MDERQNLSYGPCRLLSPCLDQSAGCQADRANDSAERAGAGGSGDRVKAEVVGNQVFLRAYESLVFFKAFFRFSIRHRVFLPLVEANTRSTFPAIHTGVGRVISNSRERPPSCEKRSWSRFADKQPSAPRQQGMSYSRDPTGCGLNTSVFGGNPRPGV